MAITLIFKNLTGAEQIVEDLGVFVPASGQVDVTSLFANNRYAPAASVSLATLINNNILILNNGSQDIAKLTSAQYLDEYSLAVHDINVTHVGLFPENRINNDGILARVGSTATITAPWAFNGAAGGQLIVENGAALPTGTIESGRIFWLTTTRTLYLGADGVWNNVTVTQNSFYNAPVMFEFGSYATIGTAGAYLNTQWSASNISPAIMARKGTIKSLSMYAASSSGTVTGYIMTLRKWSDSNWIDLISATKTGGAGYLVVNDVNVDFVEYEQVACFLQATGTNTPVVTNGHLYMEVIWRE